MREIRLVRSDTAVSSLFPQPLFNGYPHVETKKKSLPDRRPDSVRRAKNRGATAMGTLKASKMTPKNENAFSPSPPPPPRVICTVTSNATKNPAGLDRRGLTLYAQWEARLPGCSPERAFCTDMSPFPCSFNCGLRSVFFTAGRRLRVRGEASTLYQADCLPCGISLFRVRPRRRPARAILVSTGSGTRGSIVSRQSKANACRETESTPLVPSVYGSNRALRLVFVVC